MRCRGWRDKKPGFVYEVYKPECIHRIIWIYLSSPAFSVHFCVCSVCIFVSLYSDSDAVYMKMQNALHLFIYFIEII